MTFFLDLSTIAAEIKTALREELLAELRADLDREAWPGWLDVPTAARYLSVSEERIRKLVARHGIPYSQEGPGCRIFFERAALDQWMRSQVGDA
jgi:excisionase family DNA binding protein